MASKDTNISARQNEYLMHSAEMRHPMEAVQLLNDLLRSEEPLDPQWKAIWEDVRAEVTDYVPSSMMKRFDKALSKLEAIDPELKELRLNDIDSVCLLLGAGASAPEPSAIPSVMHLLPELWRRAGKIGREDIDRLANWCNEQKIENIEDLLIAAYLANFAANNSNVTDLLDYFLFRAGSNEPRERSRREGTPRVDAASIALLQDTLQVIFGLLTGTMIPAPPNAGHDAIVNFVKLHERSSIVTTNYDGCIDEAPIRAGVGLNSHVDEAKSVKSDAIDLIKIHGSINWSYCESCHEVRDFNLIDLKTSYENDTASYAVIGICKNCGGQRRPLLIPPLGFKFIIFTNLIKLWNTARERIEQADYIIVIVIGFSFPEADTYINKIIERSMTLNNHQRIVVCDPNVKLVPSLQRRFSARIDGFEKSRILAANGSADEIVPKVLLTLTEGSGEAKPVQRRKAKARTKATTTPDEKTAAEKNTV